MKILIFTIFLILNSTKILADCEELYIDRFDLAEKQFADMDIADEYTLGKPQKLRHPNIYKKIHKHLPQFKFSRYKKENIYIRSNLLNKLKHKNLLIQKVTNLKYQSRQAFFIKENIKNNNYYSMMFYVSLDCNPFSNKIKKKIVNNKKESKNDRKIPNKKQ